jgi:hypothetical protein
MAKMFNAVVDLQESDDYCTVETVFNGGRQEGR